MTALQTTTYSPFDQVVFRNQGMTDQYPQVQESKGKKGKKKALGVLQDVAPREDLPEYTTADFVEESKREQEEDADGFRIVKKGPVFMDDDDEDDSPIEKKIAPI